MFSRHGSGVQFAFESSVDSGGNLARIVVADQKNKFTWARRRRRLPPREMGDEKWSQASLLRLSYLVSMLLLPGMLFADVTGAISGVVHDPSQAAVKGVRIRITNTQTNLSLDTLTADDGSYRFLALPVGNLQSKCRDHWLPAVQRDRHRAAGERPTAHRHYS